ncbi:MAG: hypothetical protein AUH92_01255 [Acidobacteria bacterium 13_1_40CM_4_69_4]|nr:MAG: hypothetical protein AUH92_01255 [Acidobacteria bacterium 13_1_40CM_4_69_4]
MTRARATLVLLGMFVLGLASGALGMAAFGLHRLHRWGLSHDRMERFVVRRLSHRLDLDDSQRKVLEDVTHRARRQLEAIHDEFQPRVEAVFDQACEELLPVLRPEQRAKLETIRAEARERLRRHGPP